MSIIGPRPQLVRDMVFMTHNQRMRHTVKPGLMFKKEDVISVGGYIDWYCEEDYYLWIRLALAGYKFGNVSENLVNVRVGKEMYGRRGGVKYFCSEAKLQSFMLKNKMIRFPRYVINVLERLILQVLMPNKLRGFVFQKIART